MIALLLSVHEMYHLERLAALKYPRSGGFESKARGCRGADRDRWRFQQIQA
jgi:hypothetical protein